MTGSEHTGIYVYICRQCIPAGGRLPRQWSEDGVHVQVTELPCSGKTDTQYLFHAIEAGAHGLLVVTCPKGECRLSQGNYRAEIRVRTVQRLLDEIGMDPARAMLIQCSSEEDVEGAVRSAVKQLCALDKSPVHG